MNSSSEENTLKITLKDITILFSDKFIDLTNINRNIYTLITKISIPENIKLIGKLFDYIIWQDTNQDIMLISLQNAPIKSWYKIKKSAELISFVDYFNNPSLLQYPYNISLYIDTDISFNKLLNIIFNNDFIEKNIYQDTDDIKQNRLKKLTQSEKIDKLNSFYDKNSFMILSKYSKSLLEFKQINNKILVTIKYNKLNIRNRYEQIDKYIPSDVNIILYNFNILTYQELLDKSININNILICQELLNNDKNKLKEVLNNLLTNNLDMDIKNYINIKLNEIEIDNIFNKIDRDGTFKAFENSLDILLKTLYEKLSPPDTNYDINISYISDKIKYKINNLLTNKLI